MSVMQLYHLHVFKNYKMGLFLVFKPDVGVVYTGNFLWTLCPKNNGKNTGLER